METIKCCIACILPCGALDVVRIVHSNGRVEEISGGPVLAGEIMKAYPKHVLRKPPSTCPADGGGGGIVVQKPVILPPNAELQKGKIYFLMPVMATPSAAPEKQHKPAAKPQPQPAAGAAVARRRRRRKDHTAAAARDGGGGAAAAACSSGAAAAGPAAPESEKERLLANERYLSEIMKEKASTARDRRRGRVAVWRPHLESITEDDL